MTHVETFLGFTLTATRIDHDESDTHFVEVTISEAVQADAEADGHTGETMVDVGTMVIDEEGQADFFAADDTEPLHFHSAWDVEEFAAVLRHCFCVARSAAREPEAAGKVVADVN